MKGAKVRRWFAHDDKVDAAGRPVLVCRQKRIPFSKAVPVFIVPATLEAMELLATKLLNHLNKDCDSEYEMFTIEQAKAALTALLRTSGAETDRTP